MLVEKRLQLCEFLKKFLNTKNIISDSQSALLDILKKKGQSNIVSNKIQNILVNKCIEKYIDWLYIKQDWPYQIIFDGKWLFNSFDNLICIDWFDDEKLQQLNNQKRFYQILKNIQKYVGWFVIWVNFKKPANSVFEIDKDILLASSIFGKILNVWYEDNVFVINWQKLANELAMPIHIVWAVADCAAICAINKKTWTISLTHAGWKWIANGVLESLVKRHKINWQLNDVVFNLSPMAGINYEWELDKFNQNYKKLLPKLKNDLKKLWKTYCYDCWEYSFVLDYKKRFKREMALLKEKIIFLEFLKRIKEEYKIDLIKEKIIVPYGDSSKKWDFYLDRLIKIILTKLWVQQKNIYFTKDNKWNIVYTTDLNNAWPSYRIYSLWKKWIISANQTIKKKNWIIYDSRVITVIWVYPNQISY